MYSFLIACTHGGVSIRIRWHVDSSVSFNTADSGMFAESMGTWCWIKSDITELPFTSGEFSIWRRVFNVAIRAWTQRVDGFMYYWSTVIVGWRFLYRICSLTTRENVGQFDVVLRQGEEILKRTEAEVGGCDTELTYKLCDGGATLVWRSCPCRFVRNAKAG